MKLKVENFQKIKEANIDLNTITLIAGGNDSGKSTLSKILYSIIKANSTHVEDFLLNLENYINDVLIEEFSNFLFESKLPIKKLETIFDIKYNSENSDVFLSNYVHFMIKARNSNSKISSKKTNIDFSETLELSYLIFKEKFLDILKIDNLELLNTNFKNFNFAINKLSKSFEYHNFRPAIFNQNLDLFRTYMEVLLSYDFQTMIQPSLSKYFRSEFNRGNFIKKYESDNSRILLTEKNGFNIDISLNNRILLKNLNYKLPSLTDAIYIESPYLMLLESIDYSSLNLPFHITDLMKKLKSEPNVDETFRLDINQLFFSSLDEDISKKISDIINAKISYDPKSQKFEMVRNQSSYPMVNTASGIKALGIILRLVDNLTINDNTLLIFDEPEVNLHPDWQVKLAEIIVLISQYYRNIKIFINTHSPYIVQGIKYFSSKSLYNSNYVSYYLAEEVSNNDHNIIFKNVSDDPSPIFSKLSSPLENIVWGV